MLLMLSRQAVYVTSGSGDFGEQWGGGCVDRLLNPCELLRRALNPRALQFKNGFKAQGWSQPSLRRYDVPRLVGGDIASVAETI